MHLVASYTLSSTQIFNILPRTTDVLQIFISMPSVNNRVSLVRPSDVYLILAGHILWDLWHRTVAYWFCQLTVMVWRFGAKQNCKERLKSIVVNGQPSTTVNALAKENTLNSVIVVTEELTD